MQPGVPDGVEFLPSLGQYQQNRIVRSPGRLKTWSRQEAKLATSIVMPQMGYDMKEGKVVRWLKKEGEDVARGEVSQR
mgnify:CR=1 FL=1